MVTSQRTLCRAVLVAPRTVLYIYLIPICANQFHPFFLFSFNGTTKAVVKRKIKPDSKPLFMSVDYILKPQLHWMQIKSPGKKSLYT